MSKEAMKLALEALEVATTPLARDRQEVLRAITALRQALEQPAQQCRTDGRCQYAIDSGAEGMGHCPKGKCIMPAQQQEPVLANGLTEAKTNATASVMGLTKKAQQEPVAVVSGYYGGQCVILPIDPARIFNSNTALYTSPQPSQSLRDVKPLTDEQREEIAKGWRSRNWTVGDIINAIEASHGIKGDA